MPGLEVSLGGKLGPPLRSSGGQDPRTSECFVATCPSSSIKRGQAWQLLLREYKSAGTPKFFVAYRIYAADKQAEL